METFLQVLQHFCNTAVFNIISKNKATSFENCVYLKLTSLLQFQLQKSIIKSKHKYFIKIIHYIFYQNIHYSVTYS